MDDHLVSDRWALGAHQRKDVHMLLTAIRITLVKNSRAKKLQVCPKNKAKKINPFGSAQASGQIKDKQLHGKKWFGCTTIMHLRYE